MLIDSHAHIHFKDFSDDFDGVLRRARDTGVSAIVNVGTDIASSREVVALAEKYPQVFAAVGIHPHDVAKMAPDDLKALAELVRHPKTVALGEVGLDYYYEHSPRELQQERLADFIALARGAGKPLVIHCREAYDDCFRIFDATGAWELGGVFHCFTGDAKTAAYIASRGFHVSFSGIVTFKKATDVQEAARTVAAEKILVETDCPFLAPEPHRGKKNEPAYVRIVAEKVAGLRGVTLNAIEALTTANARALFRLPDLEFDV